MRTWFYRVGGEVVPAQAETDVGHAHVLDCGTEDAHGGFVAAGLVSFGCGPEVFGREGTANTDVPGAQGHARSGRETRLGSRLLALETVIEIEEVVRVFQDEAVVP